MKPINYDSLNDIVYIDDVKVSPDGSRASFVRLSIDAPANEYARSIWLQDLTQPAASAQPFTAGRKDGTPRWSKDGTRLGFISKRNGEAQVHAISLSGGEAHAVTSHPNGVSDFDWSPDGKRIVFVSALHVDERAAEDEKLAAPPEEGKPKDAWEKKREKEQREHDDTMRFDPRIVREFPYRTGTNFLNDRWQHVYLSDVPDSFSFTDDAKPKATRLTDGDINFGLPAWTHDGQALIATLSRHPEHTLIEYWDDLVRIHTDAAKREVKPLISTNYSHYHPLVSPDGKWVAMERVLAIQPEFRNVTLAIIPV